MSITGLWWRSRQSKRPSHLKSKVQSSLRTLVKSRLTPAERHEFSPSAPVSSNREVQGQTGPPGCREISEWAFSQYSNVGPSPGICVFFCVDPSLSKTSYQSPEVEIGAVCTKLRKDSKSKRISCYQVFVANTKYTHNIGRWPI